MSHPKKSSRHQHQGHRSRQNHPQEKKEIIFHLNPLRRLRQRFETSEEPEESE